MTTGSAIALVRLLLDHDREPEGAESPALDLFNKMVGELDLETAQSAASELACLSALLLRGLHDRHPGVDVDELVALWGLRVALDGAP